MLLVTSPYKTTVYCKPETSVYHAQKCMHDKSMQSKSLEIEAERHNIYLWKTEYLNCVKMTLRRVLLLLICPYFEELDNKRGIIIADNNHRFSTWYSYTILPIFAKVFFWIFMSCPYV